MILYFTGTGNSRYIAEILVEKLQDSLTDAARCIKAGEQPVFASEKPYVVVSPVYAWQLPRVLAEWLRRCRFTGNDRIYFVLTCGDSIGAAGDHLEALCTALGLVYRGTAAVVMPENYLVMFTPTAPEEDAGIFAHATAQTEQLAAQIQSDTMFDTLKITSVGRLCSGIVNRCFYTFYIGAKKFRADDRCISCGKCVESCMLNNIVLRDGKPVWGKACTHCMACICRCPTKAIEYGRQTKGRRRYVCTARMDMEK